MSQNEISQPESAQTPPPEEGLIIPFIKDLRNKLPKSEVEQHLWITKSGLFVRSEYQNNIIDVFKEFYKLNTNTEISDDKSYRKLFDDNQSDSFYLLIGHSIVVGSLIPCKTNDLRGVGIRLYEGIPLDCSNSIHQSDPIFVRDPNLTATLTRNGYTAQIVTRNLTFQIPFDQISWMRDVFRNSKDLAKYLDTSTLRGFIKTFSGSLSRAKPFKVGFFTVFPKRALSEKHTNWLRVGDTLILEKESQIIDIIPLKGRAHEELIRRELVLLVDELGRRPLAGAYLQIRKDSFLADYTVQGIAHHFGVSAIFSFLDGIIDYHREFNSYPGRLATKTSVEEVIKCFTWILRDAQPILLDKLPTSIKDDVSKDVSSFICTASEWFFGVDKAKMIRQVWFRPKVQKKIIVPVIINANTSLGASEDKKPDSD